MYGAGGTPRVRFDGLLLQIGAPSCAVAADNYRVLIEQRLNATNSLSPIRIEGGIEVDGNNAIVSATATLLDPVTLEDLRLTVLLLEDGVVVSSTTFNHVTRAALDQNITLVNPGDFVSVDHIFTNPGDWNMENVSSVAFVQRMSGDYEIYQSAMLPDGSSAVDEASVLLTDALRIDRIFPNPLRVVGSANLVVNFSLPEAEQITDASLDLIDLSGRLVRRLHSGGIGSPELRLSWDGRDGDGNPLQSGAYWLRVSSPVGSDNRKVVLIR